MTAAKRRRSSFRRRAERWLLPPALRRWHSDTAGVVMDQLLSGHAPARTPLEIAAVEEHRRLDAWIADLERQRRGAGRNSLSA